MVLIDPALEHVAPPPARPAEIPSVAPAIPHAALARLSVLRGEAGHNLSLFQFVARAPAACLVLMGAGMGTVIWTSLAQNRDSLESRFCWVLSVLAGVVAMTVLYIVSYARGSRGMPLHRTATRLRRLLFCTGLAWGAGAFLVMPQSPSPVLPVLFTALPSLALGLLLQDQKGVTGFVAPVTLATASAACLQAWPSGLWLAGSVLAGGLAIFCLPMLQREISLRHDLLPAFAPPI